MRINKIFSFALLFLFMLLSSEVNAEDKGVGKKYNNNPSVSMKQYSLKNIKPLNAESTEVIIEKELKENVQLQEKANDWKDVGFEIRSVPVTDGDQSKYLKSTPKAPSDNAVIKALADKLKGATASATAKNVFDYVNKKTEFQFYMNSKKGALGALDSGKANCCDQASLVISIMRAAGIPARYAHCNPCKFLKSGMVVGHVWPEAYVDGKWVTMDTTSENNDINQVTNYKALGKTKYYAKIPF